MKARNEFFELKTLTKPNPKNIVARIAIIFGLLVLEQFALSFVSLPLASALIKDETALNIPVNSMGEWISITFGLLLFALFLYITWRCFKATSPKGKWKLLEAPTGKHLLWSLIGYLSLVLIAFLTSLLSSLIQSSTGADDITTANEAEINSMISGVVRPSWIVLLIFISLLGPIAEELMFRGLLMNYFFANSKNRWLGIILSAFVFSLIHLTAESSLIAFLIGVLIYGAMGFVLAFVYRKTGKIQYSTIIHVVWNTFSVLISILLINNGSM